GETLAPALKAIRKRNVLALLRPLLGRRPGRTLGAALLALLAPRLAHLRALGLRCADLFLDRRPQFRLRFVELQRFLDESELALKQPLLARRHGCTACLGRRRRTVCLGGLLALCQNESSWQRNG